MKTYNDHIVDRNIIKWGSYGKFGNQPVRWTLVKDLSDSHLMRIVEHLKNRDLFNTNTLRLMEDEVRFRTKNLIFVPESYD